MTTRLARTWSSAQAGEGGVDEREGPLVFFDLCFGLKICCQLNTSFSIALYSFATIFNGSHIMHDESWRQRR